MPDEIVQDPRKRTRRRIRRPRNRTHHNPHRPLHIHNLRILLPRLDKLIQQIRLAAQPRLRDSLSDSRARFACKVRWLRVAHAQGEWVAVHQSFEVGEGGPGAPVGEARADHLT